MIREDVKRDLQTLVEDNMNNLQHSQDEYGGVYLARIDMLATDGVISLEVELDEGSIAFTFPTEEKDADECFEYLKDQMEERDIHVFTTYSDFESAMEID